MNIEQARELARRFHEGQVDQAGRPYLEHVQRVADVLSGHDEKLTALMHDLLEDTELRPTDLSCAGAPAQVVAAVQALTRRIDEPYDDFVRRAAADPIARAVKRADIADNANESRLGSLPSDVAQRLREKYRRANQILEETPVGEQSLIVDNGEIGQPHGETVAWSTQWCALCGHPAGTLSLVAADAERADQATSVVLSSRGFLGSMATGLGVDEVEGVRAALTLDDVTVPYSRDPELAPWWCPQCHESFCGSCWTTETLYDDGFLDEVRGRCPKGHEHRLWD